MFDKTPKLSETAEEEALKYMLEEHLPGSPEYKAVLEDIKTLHNLNQKKRWVPSPDGVLSACASVGFQKPKISRGGFFRSQILHEL